MYQHQKATPDDLNRIWDRSIADNPGDERYLRWKKQFIDDNESGAAATFVVLWKEEPVGEGTLLFAPGCRAIRGRRSLADGVTVCNINALRIQKAHEGKGQISKLIRCMEDYAREQGFRRITIGVEAAETRNLAIYLHWGYDKLVGHEIEDGELVLYYGKDL